MRWMSEYHLNNLQFPAAATFLRIFGVDCASHVLCIRGYCFLMFSPVCLVLWFRERYFLQWIMLVVGVGFVRF